MKDKSVFEQDLKLQMQDPEFKVLYERELQTIREVDAFINALDQTRIDLGMTKAHLARQISTDPVVIRRLFSTRGNPTLSRVIEIASALGLKLTLAPASKSN